MFFFFFSFLNSSTTRERERRGKDGIIIHWKRRRKNKRITSRVGFVLSVRAGWMRWIRIEKEMSQQQHWHSIRVARVIQPKKGERRRKWSFCYWIGWKGGRPSGFVSRRPISGCSQRCSFHTPLYRRCYIRERETQGREIKSIFFPAFKTRSQKRSLPFPKGIFLFLSFLFFCFTIVFTSCWRWRHNGLGQGKAAHSSSRGLFVSFILSPSFSLSLCSSSGIREYTKERKEKNSRSSRSSLIIGSGIFLFCCAQPGVRGAISSGRSQPCAPFVRSLVVVVVC